MAELRYPEQEYVDFDLFAGDEGDLTCRTVKLVKVRKPHACFFGINGDGHQIAPGDHARHERALVDGDFWGSYYVCIPCLNREIADLCCDTDELPSAAGQADGSGETGGDKA